MNKMRHLIFAAALLLLCAAVFGAAMDKYPHNIKDIQIRDPFILTDRNMYYMLGTFNGSAFAVRTSPDLENWSEPHIVFEKNDAFWGTKDFWAAEMHKYKGSYYLFGSFKTENACRGTQILRASSPLGPFRPISEFPQTPRDWECLDGTLYVDKKGKPWMIFCHEWLQVQDGEIQAVPLSADLRKPAGGPVLLFHASSAPWAVRPPKTQNCVTDGPFIYESSMGFLVMLWSSFDPQGRYNMGLAVSDRTDGEWRQLSEPLFADHGGHGMFFRDLSGRLCCVFHCPNSPGGLERACIYTVAEDEHGIPRLDSRLF